MKRPRRRAFLKTAGASAMLAASGLAGILATRSPPAFAQGTTLHIVRWKDFIPEADAELKVHQIPEAEKAFGAHIVLETIHPTAVRPRITAAIQSGSGPDIFHVFNNGAHLYKGNLVEVGDVTNGIGATQGDFYDVFKASFRVDGAWLGVPHCIVGPVIAYRKSWFEEVGFGAFPRTWDELREATTALKRRGRPYGQALGHAFGDAPGWAYPLMWAFGGVETDPSGQRVMIASPGTVESVRYMQRLWKEGCDEGGIAWDESRNNRAFFASEICATLNGASIYIAAKRQPDKIKDQKGQPLYLDIDHAFYPLAGVAGQYPWYALFGHGVMRYSPNQKLATDFLRWLHARDNFRKWLQASGGYSVAPTTVWEKDPMWSTFDKPLQLLRRAGRNARMFGYPAAPGVRANEVFSKYIIVDMYGKAVQGTTPEAAVQWAESELIKIYEKG